MSRLASYEDDSWAVFAEFNETVSFGPTSHYPEFHRLRAEHSVHPGLPHLGITGQIPGQPPTFSVFSYDAATTVLPSPPPTSPTSTSAPPRRCRRSTP